MASTWNGNVVPTENDFWNLVSDMRTQAIYNNRLVPVWSVSERNGLATAAPSGVIPEGTVAVRMDRGGALDVFVDSGWVEGDADWVNMVYASGFSAGTPGQMAYKVAGNTLHIKGGATGTFNASVYYQVSSTLIPAQFRPAATAYLGSVGTGGQEAGIQVSQNGYVQLVSAAAPSWISATCSLPLT